MSITAATKNSVDFALTQQLVGAIRVFENHDSVAEEYNRRYDCVNDLVTSLSRVEPVDSHAALARSAALISDLCILSDELREANVSDHFRKRLERSLRLAWQSLFFLENEFGVTAEASGFEHFAPVNEARKLFPTCERLSGRVGEHC